MCGGCLKGKKVASGIAEEQKLPICFLTFAKWLQSTRETHAAPLPFSTPNSSSSATFSAACSFFHVTLALLSKWNLSLPWRVFERLADVSRTSKGAGDDSPLKFPRAATRSIGYTVCQGPGMSRRSSYAQQTPRMAPLVFCNDVTDPIGSAMSLERPL